MFTRLEWMIAARYLGARRKEGAISVIAVFSLLGIFFGVGALIVVMSVMNGFRAELITQIVGAQPHVLVLDRSGEGIQDYDALAARLGAVSGVTHAAPRLEQTVMGSSRSEATGLLLRALRLDDLKALPGVADPEWSVGSIEDYAQGIALGEGVARKLRVGLGDVITLTTPPNKDTAFGRIPTRRSYPVVYIFRVGYHHYDSSFVFLPLDEAQGLLNKRGRVDGIELNVAAPDTLAGSYAEPDPLSVALAREAGPGRLLWNWKNANGAFIAALDTERAAMFVILSLIIVIAALNIISGLIMLVKEKGPNIGIMRTFGMTRGAILRVFFLCGAAIGIVGTVLGVLGGVVFVIYIQEIQAFLEWALGIPLWPVEIRGLSRIPAIMHLSDVLMTMAVSLVLSLLATWYPAWRAGRLDPVEALRYE